jgi:hypothetical protein
MPIHYRGVSSKGIFYGVCDLGDEPPQYEYWLTRSVQERVAGVEELRRTFYGTALTESRLPRVFGVVESTPR